MAHCHSHHDDDDDEDEDDEDEDDEDDEDEDEDEHEDDDDDEDDDEDEDDEDDDDDEDEDEDGDGDGGGGDDDDAAAAAGAGAGGGDDDDDDDHDDHCSGNSEIVVAAALLETVDTYKRSPSLLSVPGSQIPAYVHVLSHGMHKCQSNCRDDSETKPLGAVKKKKPPLQQLPVSLFDLIGQFMERHANNMCIYIYNAYNMLAKVSSFVFPIYCLI